MCYLNLKLPVSGLTSPKLRSWKRPLEWLPSPPEHAEWTNRSKRNACWIFWDILKYLEYKSLTVSLLIFHFGFNLLHWKTRTLHLNKTPSNLAESSTMSRKIHKYEAALKPLFYAFFHHLAIKLGNRFEWLVCVSWSESRAKFHFLLQALQSLSHCRYGNDMSWVFLCSIELCK